MKKPRRTVLRTLGALAIGTLISPFTKLHAKGIAAQQANTGPIRAILIGAGNRGNCFAKYALSHAQQLQIVGIADPKNPMRAKLFAVEHGISMANCTAQAKDLYEKPKFADVVILTEHVYTPSLATAALKAGYEVWMDQSFISIAVEREVEAVAQQAQGSVKVVHVVTKDILPPHQTSIEKQALFSPAFQEGQYPYFLVLGSNYLGSSRIHLSMCGKGI